MEVGFKLIMYDENHSPVQEPNIKATSMQGVMPNCAAFEDRDVMIGLSYPIPHRNSADKFLFGCHPREKSCTSSWRGISMYDTFGKSSRDAK